MGVIILVKFMGSRKFKHIFNALRLFVLNHVYIYIYIYIHTHTHTQ